MKAYASHGERNLFQGKGLYTIYNHAILMSLVLPSFLDPFKTETMVKDLISLREHISKQPEADGDKIGSIGFCLGGGLVFQLAADAPIKATSVFYGANPDPVTSISNIKGKVIGVDAYYKPVSFILLRKMTDIFVLWIQVFH